MLKRDNQRWEDDFPLRGEVEDFSGKTRIFVITCHEGGHGFTVRSQPATSHSQIWDIRCSMTSSAAESLGTAKQVWYCC